MTSLPLSPRAARPSGAQNRRADFPRADKGPAGPLSTEARKRRIAEMSLGRPPEGYEADGPCKYDPEFSAYLAESFQQARRNPLEEKRLVAGLRVFQEGEEVKATATEPDRSPWPSIRLVCWIALVLCFVAAINHFLTFSNKEG